MQSLRTRRWATTQRKRGGDEIGLDAEIQQADDGACRGIGVQRRQHEVAGERGVDADAGRFPVAHLADHDDVGVEAQERAQRAREAQADFRVHLDLVHARDLVFDGILDGDDLAGGIVELAQCRGKRRGLAAARGARHHDHAMRMRDLALEPRQVRLRQAEADEFRRLGVGAQEADGDALAMDRGHGGDADVVIALGDPEPGAAILRQPLFGDVEIGEDLEARHGGTPERHRQPLDLRQEPVHPAPDDHMAAGGLDMKVRGARRGGLAEQAVQKVDDRRIERHVLQRVVVFAGISGRRAAPSAHPAPCSSLSMAARIWSSAATRSESSMPAASRSADERRLIRRVAQDDGQPACLRRPRPAHDVPA